MEERKTIQKNDLMIGNYIRDIWSENGFFKVTELRKDKVFYGNCFKAQYKDIQPIPLTEEILLKCGFEVEYTNGGFLRWQKGDFKLLDRRLPHPINNMHKEYVLYLHELQNLYKALTKSDLTI